MLVPSLSPSLFARSLGARAVSAPSAGYCASAPPSMTSSLPLTYELSSEAR